VSDADEILIGEGVVLESGAAPVTHRMLSGLIDYVVTIAVLIFAFAMLDQVWRGLESSWQAAISIAVIAATLVGIPTLVETVTRGRSLGKLAAGLRVVRDDGGPVTVRHAVIRSLVGVFEIYMTAGTVAVTVSMLSARGKRIGDYLAGTYAMRTRGVKSQLGELTMPPHMAAWASTADIRRLPDGLALTTRLFLSRATSLRPDSRARIGADLNQQVSQYVAPAPPYGTHPEYFLAAVLAARRDRELDIETARLRRAHSEGAKVGALPYGIADQDN
jgi:uncharacterized RDD family membrane protein YckC